jgi:hypothetical protein
MTDCVDEKLYAAVDQIKKEPQVDPILVTRRRLRETEIKIVGSRKTAAT